IAYPFPSMLQRVRYHAAHRSKHEERMADFDVIRDACADAAPRSRHTQETPGWGGPDAPADLGRARHSPRGRRGLVRRLDDPSELPTELLERPGPRRPDAPDRDPERGADLPVARLRVAGEEPQQRLPPGGQLLEGAPERAISPGVHDLRLE